MIKLYEVFVLFLIAISIASIWIDFTYTYLIDILIWVIFAIDYSIRLWRSENKKQFIKSNILELIALIPLDAFFRSFRIVRVFRVFRLGVYFYRYAKPVVKVLGTNGLYKMLTFTGVIVLGGAVVIYFLEPNITNMSDALWWAIVTATTVGYGDISPETNPGRFVATILMLTGIGTLGMVTGSIATYFLAEKEEIDLPSSVRHIQYELGRYHDLTEEELRALIRYMEALLDSKQKEQSKLSE